MIPGLNGTKRAVHAPANVREMMHLYRSNNLSVIPVDDQRRPYFRVLRSTPDDRSTWIEYQKRPASDEEIDAWCDNGGPELGIGIVHGAISGNLAGLDADDERFARWLIDKQVSLAKYGCWGRQTGSGKSHIDIRSAKPVAGTVILAPDGTKLADVRGEGGYLVVEPSRHPSGEHYARLIGGPDAIGTVPDAMQLFLILADTFLRQTGQTEGAYATADRNGPAVAVTVDLPSAAGDLSPSGIPITEVKGWRVRIAAYGCTLKGLIEQEFPKGSRSEPMHVAAKELLRAGNNERAVARLLWHYPIGAKAREKGWNWTRGEIARAKHAVEVDRRSAPAVVQLGLVKAVADAIMKQDRFAQDKGQRLFWYGNGAFRLDGDEYIRYRTRALLDEWNLSKKWSSARGTEVAEYIRLGFAPTLWEQPPVDILNVRNGLLDLRTFELRPHSPEHLSPLQLPVLYDPSATCKW